MKPWLLIDCETTGTDPAKDRLVEIGAVLFDPLLGIPVRAESVLIAGDDNAAEQVNRIPAAALRGTWCVDELTALERVGELASDADFLLAHNADFDRQWLDGSLPPGAHWIDTCDGAEWPRASSSRSLVALALAHDLGVARAHRAIEDCLLLAALLTRTHEIEGGLGPWLSRAIEPRVDVAAELPMEENDAAKEAGFRWDREAQIWRRSVRVSQIEALRQTWPFETFDPSEIEVHYNGEEPTFLTFLRGFPDPVVGIELDDDLPF